MRLHRLRATITAAGLLVSLAAPCYAQHAPRTDGALTFERVGHVPIDAEDLAFDAEGRLWATETSALLRLSTVNVWHVVFDEAGTIGHFLLTLAPDTLLVASRSTVHRSTDGGETFESVHSDGGGALFAAPLGGPNDGLVLVGTELGGTGIAYSTDRGASFTPATFTDPPPSLPFMEAAVEIPAGPAAGRLVAGVFGGVVVSEDGGRTWAPSSLFQSARYWIQRLVIGEDPLTGDRRLYATVADAQTPGVQFYASDDDGLTWTNVPGMVDAYLIAFAPETTGSLFAVERADAVDGELVVWQSLDAGQSWVEAGELPAEVDGDLLTTRDMVLGPDGHLYVAVGRSGPEHEWVYRTTAPVGVAAEPGPEVLPEPSALSVRPNPARSRARVAFALAAPAHVEIVVVDLLGRRVARLADARFDTGTHAVVFDGTALPSGLYLVRLTTDEGMHTRTLTLLR